MKIKNIILNKLWGTCDSTTALEIIIEAMDDTSGDVLIKAVVTPDQFELIRGLLDDNQITNFSLTANNKVAIDSSVELCEVDAQDIKPSGGVDNKMETIHLSFNAINILRVLNQLECEILCEEMIKDSQESRVVIAQNVKVPGCNNTDFFEGSKEIAGKYNESISETTLGFNSIEIKRGNWVKLSRMRPSLRTEKITISYTSKFTGEKVVKLVATQQGNILKFSNIKFKMNSEKFRQLQNYAVNHNITIDITDITDTEVFFTINLNNYNQTCIEEKSSKFLLQLINSDLIQYSETKAIRDAIETVLIYQNKLNPDSNKEFSSNIDIKNSNTVVSDNLQDILSIELKTSMSKCKMRDLKAMQLEELNTFLIDFHQNMGSYYLTNVYCKVIDKLFSEIQQDNPKYGTEELFELIEIYEQKEVEHLLKIYQNKLHLYNNRYVNFSQETGKEIRKTLLDGMVTYTIFKPNK